MTAINLLSSKVDISSIKKLDALKLEVKELPPEMKANLDEIWKNRFKIPVGKPDNSPDNIYATVKINGHIVATLYNSGSSVTSNSAYVKVKNLPSMGENEKSVGPELAQKRAEEIAKVLGGKVEKATTAKTAAQWQPSTMEWTYDYKRMEEAHKVLSVRMELDKNIIVAFGASAKTKFDAQLIGQLQDSYNE
ncbi:MAG: hypothetical protein K0R98_1435 [Rickettsiaceae bacterium]|jgi:hypothetical protein|nr:hypothetical protein [Rickettsiaceae bacterium]